MALCEGAKVLRYHNQSSRSRTYVSLLATLPSMTLGIQNERYAAPAPAPQKPSSKVWWLVGGGLFLFLLLGLYGLLWMMMRATGEDDGAIAGLGSNIAVVDIEGVILSADKTNEQIEKFEQDSSVKAIILHIDSPGGAAAPSQEIYHEVIQARERYKKPIVASIQSVGASGAYYIASATDKIYADQASIVGSIGVIAEWVNYGDLLRWAKLKPEILKAGELKDAGNPTRELTPAERAYLQELIDNMHTQFINDVATGRKLPVDSIKSIASGRVWTGQQALPMHLIDATGNFRDALLDTAKRVGIHGEPKVVRPAKARHKLLDLLSADASDLFPDPGKLLDHNKGFFYLWKM
jgi:protease-4